MSGISLGGLISGVDTDGIVKKLMDIENQRITSEQMKKTVLQARQDAWNSIKTSLGGLRSKMDSLRLVGTFRARSVTLTDPTVATATASSSATLTTHSLSVSQLAQTQAVAGAMVARATDALGVSGAVAINGKDVSLVATDTLYSLRDKINTTADVGVTADVVQVMDGSTTKYRMVLTSKTQGTAGAITMSGADETYAINVTGLAVTGKARSDTFTDPGQLFTGSFTLSGQSYNFSGATLDDISTAINANVSGLATVVADTNGGNYLQLDDTAIAGAGFTLTNDSGLLQQLGLMKQANQQVVRQSAAFTVDNGTGPVAKTSDTNVWSDPAYAGLTLSLNAVGTQSVNVGTAAELLGFQDASGAYGNEIARAQDARFTLDNVDYVKSTNVIADVLPKMSITLTKAGTVAAPVSTTITVGQDPKPLADGAQAWVDGLNATLSLLKSQTDYNSDTKQAGILNGDGLARNLLTALRGMISKKVDGLPDDLNQLSQVGITTGAWGTDDYGKVLLDTEKLKSKLLANPDGVANVFGALRNNVALAAVGSSTAPGTFAAADVVNGDSDSSRFGTAGGGWQSANVPDSTTSADLDIYFDATHATKKTFDQVQIFIPDTTDYPAASAGLKDYTLQYYGDDNTWHDITTVTSHTGSARTLEFDPVTASGVRLKVTATYGTNNPARVTELKVNEVNYGGPASMYAYLKSTLSFSSGPIDTRTENFTKQMDDMDTQIARMTAQMNQHEEALRQQFARMEAALAKMQSQGNMLMGQLMGPASSK
jgi:flagellar hook-associated protein 2